jgi:tetratricopeptide (TPR) repeat protein
MDFLAPLETSADVQERHAYNAGKALLRLAQGDAAGAQAPAEDAWAAQEVLGVSSEAVKEGFVVAVEAALALDDLARAEELLAAVQALAPGRSPQFLQAHASRFRARLAGRRGEFDEAERLFKGAAGLFRELSVPFYLAVTLLEHGEWLAEQQRAGEAEPLLVEAREIFERLGAAPWLARAAKSPAGVEQAEVTA